MSYFYDASLVKRYKLQNRFRLIGKFAILAIFLFIGGLFSVITYNAIPAFQKTYIAVDVVVDEDKSSRKIINDYMYEYFDVKGRKNKKEIRKFFSSAASRQLDEFKEKNQGLLGEKIRLWLPASDIVDQYVKGKVSTATSESRRVFSDQQISWVNKLKLTEQIKTEFNFTFISGADSRDPAEAGIMGAVLGSIMTILVCIFISVIIGVASAIYLVEFSPKNRISFLIESTINNLAAVPSIIFGLLGLAILLNVFGLQRGGSITGGIVLGLMSLPTIVITTSKALSAIPDTIRHAGLALGCTKLQVITKFILPQASPRIVTGVIIAMAQALGETAPLLMIGMVAFVADIPQNLTDSAVTLPVQIYLWADASEKAFVEKTYASILILLLIVSLLITIATIIRNKFEKK